MNRRRQCGYSIIELMVVVAVVAIVCAVAIPGVLTAFDSQKLGDMVRAVHSEMQSARLKAVSSDRPMRIRFNCPVAGQYRVVELLGTPSAPATDDGAADRCGVTRFPYPATDTSVLTRPNNDGPVRFLPAGGSFSAAPIIEFWPDGTAHVNSGGALPWPAIAGNVTVTVAYKTKTRSITVNGVGKIQIVP